MEKNSSKSAISLRNKIIIYVILSAIALIMLFPLYYLVNISFKSTTEFFRNPTGLVQDITFDNYKYIFISMQVLKRSITTVALVSVTCAASLVISIIAAFPLGRSYFKSANKVTVFIIASMFFPGSLVANIIILKDVLQIYGSPFSLIIMWVSGGIQLNIFMLIGFVKTIPRDLDEAAFLDGCSYFKYIMIIALPLLTPIISTLVLIKAISSWNDFLGPFIYMTDPEFKTLSTGLYSYMSQYGAEWNKFATAIFIVAMPMIAIYIFFQRYIIDGLASGALKG